MLSMLCAVFIFGAVFFPALRVFAAGYTLADMENDSAAYYSSPTLRAGLGTNVDAQTIFNGALEFLETGLNPEETSIWAAKTLFSIIMGGSDDPNAQLLDEVKLMMEKQNELAGKISQLENEVISASVVQDINQYLQADKAGLVKTYYGALRQIDVYLSDGTLTQSDGMAQRKTILVSQIPGAAPLGSICPFDELTYSLGSLLTMDHVTVLPNLGHAKIFNIYDEWQKRNYKWEHQGYEDRAFFQNCAISQYLTAASIDKLSLTARIQELPAAQQTLFARV